MYGHAYNSVMPEQGGVRGATRSPNFWQISYPIRTEGTDSAHPLLLAPQFFSPSGIADCLLSKFNV